MKDSKGLYYPNTTQSVKQQLNENFSMGENVLLLFGWYVNQYSWKRITVAEAWNKKFEKLKTALF